MRKQIVHNKHVVADLEAKGAIFVEETSEVPEGSIVVLSAHGVAPTVYAEATQRNLRTIDATCPLVTKVHHEARRFSDEGLEILLIGHAVTKRLSAPRVRRPIESSSSTDRSTQRESKCAIRHAWPGCRRPRCRSTRHWRLCTRFASAFPQLMDPPSDDICYATQNRQAAVKQIAPASDLVIVVGSRNSSNSVRLVEVALESGARASHLVDDSSEIDEGWLDGVTTVGLTSGASVPDSLVLGVLAWLADRGFTAVEEIEAVRETLTFALPPELRRDIKEHAERVDARRSASRCATGSVSVPDDRCCGGGTGPHRWRSGHERVADVDRLARDESAALVVGVNNAQRGDQDAVEQWRREDRGGQIATADDESTDGAGENEDERESRTSVAGEGDLEQPDETGEDQGQDDDAATCDAPARNDAA